MNDQSKTKTQLIDELEQTRTRVAELEQVEAALRESEEKYQTIYENVHDQLIYLNKYGTIIHANDHEETYGRTPEEIIGKNFTKLGYFDVKDIPKYLKLFKDVITGEKTFDVMELEVKHKDGHKIPVEVSTSLIKKNGKIEGFLCVVRDITERKRAGETLKESEEHYRELSDSITDIFFAFDKDLKYTYWNKASEELTGISAQDAIGRSLNELFPDTPQTIRAEKVYLDVLRTQQSQTFVQEYQLGGKDYFFEISAYPSKEGLSVFTRDITERKQAEENLRISEEKFRRLFETMQDGVLIADARNGEIIDLNPYLVKLINCNPEALKGKVLWEASPFNNMIGVEEGFKDLQDEGITRFITAFRAVQNGIKLYMEFTNRIFLIDGRKIIHCNVRDITETKLAEKALRESEEKYRQLVELSPDSIAIHQEGKIVFINTAGVRQLGAADPEQLIGKPIMDFLHPDYHDIVKERIQRINKEKEEAPLIEEKIIRLDGTVIDVDVTVVTSNYKGKPAVQAIARDITERKQAEEELRQSEEKYRQLFATVSDAIVMFDANTRQFLDVNAKAIELYGYTREEFLRMKQPDISAEPKASELSISETLAGYRERIPLRYHKKKDDTVFPVEISSAIFNLGDQQVICGVIRDITERKQAEEALRGSEEKYRTLFEQAPVGITTMDLKGVITSCNPAVYQKGGYTEEDLVGKHFSKLAPLRVRDIPRFIGIFNSIIKGETPKPFETTYQRRDGTPGWTEIHTSLLKVGDKKLGIQVIQRDITERKRAEDELRESREQLRSLSAHLQSIREESQKLLAREIHDELGQDLTALKMDLSWLKGKLRQDQELLREKAAAMTKLADAMIKTVKKITARLRPALLDDLGVSAALEWELGEFAERTGIECNLTVKPEEIDLDQDRSTAVYRIFQEALTNIARHSQATSVEAALRVDSGRLEMEISDNGAGITEEQIASPQSFGLIGIRERAMQFGGEVRIEGVKGKGTTISITLPLDDGGDHHD